MRKCLLSVIVAIALCVLPAMAEERLSVVCTDFPCYDFARQAAGEYADVTMLIKPGMEVHAYDPSPVDILNLSDADVFIYIGGESDAWADGILDSFGSDGPAVLRLMDCVDGLIEEEDADHDDEAPEYDEHIWTSPRNAAAMVRAVGEALAETEPSQAEACREAAEAYAAQIEVIDAQFEAIVENAARHTLVFADRFPFIYFVRQYGLEYAAAFPSCTADAEASPQTIMRLIDTVSAEEIPVIYTIEMSTQNVARIVAEETGAEILTMHSAQTVTQSEFEAGETYVSLMEKNVEALRRGLE